MIESKYHRNRFFFFLLIFALALAIWPTLAVAQTVTGTLQGTVTDSKGAVIPGVDVVVRNEETGQERNLRTNSEGIYTATFLPLGTYSIKASGQGF
ncbi:MAG TPA: carboxypeptidase-like regulatory domain-containing protein, partial [Pyrinomonadaceae bacterium]|nr:carboxypeptidase-like regulatory domain-containing protein [Pyrinomonadaceae bacterium]